MEQSDRTGPLVSVIMPSYRSEPYLAEAIESVRAQTCTDWELLIIDDCSPDGAAEIARAYAAKDPRIRLLVNETNCGAAGTRNRGIALAAGEWIALLDSDDRWRPEKLETQLAKAAQTGARLIYSSYSMFSGTSRADYLVPETVCYRRLLSENVIGCSTVLLHSDIAKSNPFSTQIYHEDYALWLRLLRQGVRAAGCPVVLTDWRITKSARSYDKRNAAKQRWIIYRQEEKLSLPRALLAFGAYALHGICKNAKAIRCRT